MQNPEARTYSMCDALEQARLALSKMAHFMCILGLVDLQWLPCARVH